MRATNQPFEFKVQHDVDLNIALEVDPQTLEAMYDRGMEEGLEVRGIANHDFVRSIYFRDPNGYVIELTARTERHDQLMDSTTNGAKQILAQWHAAKGGSAQTT